MKKPFELINHPKLDNPSLIIGWNEDTGNISPKVIDFINKELNGQKFCDINPVGYFSMEGVDVDDDYIRFPESRFYYSERKDLLIFKSDQPVFKHNIFLNSVLDLVENFCRIKEIYTINGMISSFVHTSPRRIFSVFNGPEFQESFQSYGLEGLTWEGAPAISSFLLWVAKRRVIPGISLWIEVPFYLAAVEDFESVKLALSFFNQRFSLNMFLDELDLKIREQNEKIELLREEKSEVNKYISLLESGMSLDEEEQIKLTKEIYRLFKG